MGTLQPSTQYDMLMLPCEGTGRGSGLQAGQQELANFINFANAGGRVYSSHYLRLDVAESALQ
jgi:hypothetical protein